MKRRSVLKGMAILGASTVSAPTNHAFAMGESVPSDDPLPFTAVEIASAIKSGDVSAVDVANMVIDRVQAGQHLEAYITFLPDAFLGAAQAADYAVMRGDTLGPLHGVPIALKDNIEAVGYPNTGGTPALRTYRPQRNATVTQRLVDAGAVIAGKLNMDELAGGGTSNNPTFGRVRNPYKTDHVPGGSSGGSAAAVGGRLYPQRSAPIRQGLSAPRRLIVALLVCGRLKTGFPVTVSCPLRYREIPAAHGDNCGRCVFDRRCHCR